MKMGQSYQQDQTKNSGRLLDGCLNSSSGIQ